jgi:hypothetical protein
VFRSLKVFAFLFSIMSLFPALTLAAEKNYLVSLHRENAHGRVMENKSFFIQLDNQPENKFLLLRSQEPASLYIDYSGTDEEIKNHEDILSYTHSDRSIYLVQSHYPSRFRTVLNLQYLTEPTPQFFMESLDDVYTSPMWLYEEVPMPADQRELLRKIAGEYQMIEPYRGSYSEFRRTMTVNLSISERSVTSKVHCDFDNPDSDFVRSAEGSATAPFVVSTKILDGVVRHQLNLSNGMEVYLHVSQIDPMSLGCNFTFEDSGIRNDDPKYVTISKLARIFYKGQWVDAITFRRGTDYHDWVTFIRKDPI